MLKPDNNNFVSWMYIEEEQCRVIRGLDSLAKQGRISWGVYTTIGKRVAFDIPEQLLLRQGSVRFVMSRGHPPRSMLIGAARWLWFLTQDYCDFDNSVGAVKFSSTGHVRRKFLSVVAIPSTCSQRPACQYPPHGTPDAR